jgi:predicted phage terminase large subunit-like protein
MSISRADFNAALRGDLYTFIQRCHAELNPGEPFLENWHVELLAAELMAVFRGEERRLLVNLPPRNLKSLCISVSFVAWVLGHAPGCTIMVVSYGQELAEKLGRDTRQIMQSAWYRSAFPHARLSPARQAASDFETTAGGGRVGVSSAGAITGRGTDLMIVDDPTKADDAMSEGMREAANENFARTLISRLTNKVSDAVIVVMQRLHEDDLCGKLLESGGWRHVKLAAIAEEDEVWEYDTPFGRRRIVRLAGEALHPEREPLEALAEIRRLQGSYHFAAQYQQNPVPLAGNAVNIGLLNSYGPHERPAVFDEEILSLDTAFKAHDMADYSVCTHWGRKDKRLYLLGVWRTKATYFELKVKLKALAQTIRPRHILIEDCASGQSLIQELKHECVYSVVACKPKADKQVRMMEASILIEGGDVFIPADAPWLADYLHELAAFPNGRWDDQVDSTSQALNWFREKRYEPGIFVYYREEAEKLKRADEPGEPTVWMRPPPATGGGFGRTGRQYQVDWTTGLVLVCENDVLGFRTAGWVVVEAPAP